MPIYKAPVEDVTFLLNDVFQIDRYDNLPGFTDASADVREAILGEAANVPAHNTRTKWAQQTMTMPDGAAGQVAPAVVMDPAVQQDGSAITDSALQSAVENTVNKMI